MPVVMDINEFNSVVDSALDLVPMELATLIDNVVLIVEEQPDLHRPELLGIYEGIPLTERDSSYFGVLPDRIRIFKPTILRMCQTHDDVVDQVAITVIHEIAHHFGIDDARLQELGWG